MGLRERYWFTWIYIERTACNQECKQREVECAVCGLQSKDCNGLRHLGTKKHSGRVENGGGVGDTGGEDEGAVGRS